MAWLRRLSAVALAATLLVPGSSVAASREPKRLDRTVRYLQDVQHRDGGFGEHGSDPTFSAWAALALAAAGVNPRDQRKPGAVDAYTYLTRHTAGLKQTTDFARVVLVASAAGASPDRFGAVAPVRRMLAGQRSDGGFAQRAGQPAAVNATSFAVLAMKSTGKAGLRSRANRAMDWLVSNQADDGSWDGVDLTASAIEALNAGGRRRTAAQAKALAFIRSRQNADGGFGQGTPDEPSNAASTSWVARALVAAGVDARTWRARESGKTPLDYLAAMQQSDGSERYSASSDTNGVWMTTYAAPALAGVSLPIAMVERQSPESQPKKEATPTHTRGDDGGQRGAGGTATGGNGDVTAGGGGNGAPLFSRPRPGSRGHETGGRRVTTTPPKVSGGGDGAGGQTVTGKLIGPGTATASSKRSALSAAPGLRTAAAGGDSPPALVAGIGASLLLAALGGVQLERAPRRRRRA
jgi:prenyltransferase beta subunit